MINLTRLTHQALSSEPYRWASIDQLFSVGDREALVKSFPRDHFKTVEGYDGEKGYHYEARSLVAMGADAPTRAECLSPAWQCLADELLSPAYREAMSRLTQVELADFPMEANVFHYGRSAWLGPHVDLEDKAVTHVFYFNEVWDEADGGCLTILRSADMTQVVKAIPPLAGNSVMLVRSENSWHAVSRVRDKCRTSRRSMTVTFYRPSSPSTMWPAGDVTPLHDYTGEHSAFGRWVRQRLRR
ncbi:MAG: 2OG-Fe(II) oxygenase [Acidobacteriota bacterium]|nr:2OG-Fe(II) oxygenase [Acidobacteriota bacterium]